MFVTVIKKCTLMLYALGVASTSVKLASHGVDPLFAIGISAAIVPAAVVMTVGSVAYEYLTSRD